MPNSIAIVAGSPAHEKTAQQLADQFNLAYSTQADAFEFVIQVQDDGLHLHWNTEPPLHFYLDYNQGRSAYRRNSCGKQHLLAKAMGLRKHPNPSVIDATAGWGEDSILMATWGCRVLMLEQSPAVNCLLHDALQRAGDWLTADHLQRRQSDACAYLQSIKQADRPDIVYLDPMFHPLKQKSQVKKGMQMLRALLHATATPDTNQADLFEAALASARYRVVVKRHKNAAPIVEHKAHQSMVGSSTRYDVYLSPH